MQARMKFPATIFSDAMKGIQSLNQAVTKGGVPQTTLELVHLRASQINGCSFCVDAGMRGAKKAGEADERLWLVAAWAEAPYFTEAERAALELAEVMTRLSDHSGTDAVPDALWDRLKQHYNDEGLSALILWIATTNLFNRINTALKQPAGAAWT